MKNLFFLFCVMTMSGVLFAMENETIRLLQPEEIQNIFEKEGLGKFERKANFSRFGDSVCHREGLNVAIINGVLKANYLLGQSVSRDTVTKIIFDKCVKR